MPYTEKPKRTVITALVDRMMSQIVEPGDLTYAMFLICKRYMQMYGPRYRTLHSIMGCLDCTSKEFYRRYVAPAEDLAMEKNGDVE
jgi:hypothetical protein